MPRRIWFAAAAVLLVPLLAACVAVYHYVRVERPSLLRAAAEVPLGLLDTDVPPEVVLPPATAPGNAAAAYVAALNAYTARRPAASVRMMDPYAPEPPISPKELHALAQGGRQRSCDLYEHAEGQPRLEFTEPGARPWPFVVAVNPFVLRPYSDPLRALAQAALDWGKRQEALRRWPDAERAYRAVARLGWHLRARPGALTDIEIGLELEHKGLHNLLWLYRHIPRPDLVRRCGRYHAAVERLQDGERRKYAALGNPEAAKRVLRADPAPVWRIEAAVALAAAARLGRFSWLERRSIYACLAGACADPDVHVREAVRALRSGDL